MTIATTRAGYAAFALAAFFSTSALADGVVNVYTQRQPELIQPVLDAFTAETGIKTEVLFLDKGLEERVAAEGVNSPADVIMTVDIARLTAAKEKGITQPLVDDTVNKLLAWMTDNQATGEDGAKYFLENNEDIWTKWVSPEVAEKIKSSL